MNALRTFSPRRGEKVAEGRMRGPSPPMLVIALALLLLAAPAAHACPVCFGAPNTPASNGMNNAIAFLLTIVGFVQVGFVALFFTFWRRARALRRRREELQLIDGGVR